jgi:hypothetical protein
MCCYLLTEEQCLPQSKNGYRNSGKVNRTLEKLIKAQLTSKDRGTKVKRLVN